MKKLNHVWPEICSFSNLYKAFIKARKGKRNRAAVIQFELNLESELFTLQDELQRNIYYPRPYRLFVIKERKRREIAAADFRDRVVQHAIMHFLEPHLEQYFIAHSYACRKGKGVHAAVNQYQHWTQHFEYCLKLDVKRYFPSVSHYVLKRELRRYFADIELLDCLDKIIDSYPAEQPEDAKLQTGMPIGNLTSQFFANLYLNSVDHYLAARSDIRYLRYVDDFILLGRDKAALWLLRDRLNHQLGFLRITLHPNKAQIMPTRDRVDVLGYKVSKTQRWLRNDNGYRFARRLRKMQYQYAKGNLGLHQVKPRIASWLGHAKHGDTKGLVHSLLEEAIFKRGSS